MVRASGARSCFTNRAGSSGGGAGPRGEERPPAPAAPPCPPASALSLPPRMVTRGAALLGAGAAAAAARAVGPIVVALPPVRLPVLRPAIAPRLGRRADDVARAAHGRCAQI